MNIPEGYEAVDVPEGYEVVGGESPPKQSGHSALDYLNAGVETVANTAAGLATFPASMFMSGMHGLSELTSGSKEDWKKYNFDKETGQWNQNMMEPFHSRTSELGEKGSDAVGEFINSIMLPLSGHSIPPVGRLGRAPRAVKETKVDVAPRSVPKVEIPKGYERVDINLNEGPNLPASMQVTPEGQAMRPGDVQWRDQANAEVLRQRQLAATQSELPLENSSQQVAEMQARGIGQRDIFEGLPDPNTSRVIPEVEFGRTIQSLMQEQKYAEAQALIEARQRTMEESVARQGAGDREAAAGVQGDAEIAAKRQALLEQQAVDRARQEQASTGYSDLQVSKAAEEAKQTHDFLSNAHQQEIDATPHGDVPAQFGSTLEHGRIDENGIPIRADLSMEAQNLENPLQRNLWGDELPGKTGDGGVPLTRALDKMPAGPERDLGIRQLGGMGRSQRGGLNLTEIMEGIRKLIDPDPIKGLDKLKVEPTRMENLSSLPGVAAATKDYIPENPNISDMKAAILKEGAENGKILGKYLRAGATSIGDQRGSALIQGTARVILNGVKRAERNVRDFVEPFEKAVGKLSSDNVKEFAVRLKEEMFDNKRQDESSPAYDSFRKMQEEALLAQNEARAVMGLKEVTPREAYLSSRWNGSFKIPVYDKAGKLVWYIAENSKYQAESALKFLQKNGLEVDLKKSMDNKKYGQGYLNKRGPLEESYSTMLNMLDQTDPRFEGVKSLMEEAMANNAYDTLGQKHHFDPKSNVRGFVGDQPWRNDTRQAYAMLRQQVAYAKNAFQWAESQKAVSQLKELLADGEVNQLQPNNVEYARQYIKNHLGFGESKIIRDIENAVSQAVGVDKSLAYTGVGMAKGVFLTMKLAANVGYYTSQMFQMLNSIPEHALWDSRGYKHNPITTAARANMDFAAATTTRVSDLTGGFTPKLPFSKLGEEAWNYMEQNGISNRNILDEAQGLGEHKVAAAVKKVVDTGISVSEQIIRANTFLQFAHHFDQSGKFSKVLDVLQKAEEATNLSMVDFRKEERAMAFSKMGLVGRGAETLKSYLVSYYSNMGRYSQEALKGSPKALMYALGVQVGLYGALNLPGFQEVNDGIDLLKSNVSDPIYEHIKDIDPRKWLIEHMGDWAYGGASKVTGLNLSTRGNIAIDQSFALDGLFPFITDAYKQAKAVGSLAMDPTNTTKQAQAAYQVAPSGPVQGNIAMSEPFQAGKTPQGETIYQKPSRLLDHEHDFDRNEKQITNKKWGFTDLAEAKYKDLTYAENQDAKDLDERRKKVLNNSFDALVRKDWKDFDTYNKRYLNFNGDPDELVTGLTREAMKMKASPERLQAINSSNIPTLRKLQALKALVQEIR